MSKLQELLRGWNRTFQRDEKVVALTGIYADRIGKIRSELGGSWWWNEYSVDFGDYNWQWYHPWQIVSLEEIEDNTPHPEYLKW